ncbi:MAG: hypothetical protein HXX10_03755 [Rhodoplanes sp.]|uniref:DUF6064 family protein n=1 Tax=Rhodoplanes sp. TaxID=1968906 RepID=UPI0018425196|nr:DUF6064 family protein [Rhodoplanes sp.]NVO13129.1 hypothetical protein [Rhodoplanes sp.]
MSEWWTYELSDFLMFSPRVYVRLLAAYNAAMWPAQVVTIALGLAAAALLLVPMRGRERLVPAALGVLWTLVAWAFLWERYATINWGALYAAPAFALQGVVLIAAGLSGRLSFPATRSAGAIAAAALLVAIVLGWPLLAPLFGRPFDAAEVFGLVPDPTALATLALLAAIGGGARIVLMIIPALWSLIAAATLFTLGSSAWVLVLAAAAAAVALSVSRRTPPAPRRW